jgi:hypothetical protein
VIQGSHAQLEMPRTRLKQNSNESISTNRVVASRSGVANGTSAMPNVNNVRVPQPASTKRL